jgi:hypothetical protein
VVTVTSTVLAGAAGDVATQAVVELQDTAVLGKVPNLAETTPGATTKPVPVMVTTTPPPMGPMVGVIPVTTGMGEYVKRSAFEIAEVPPEVVTVTSTDPADPAGALAVMEVAEFTVKEVAAVVPKVTAVAPVKPVPVMVTTAAPVIGPDEGAMAVTAGIGA